MKTAIIITTPDYAGMNIKQNLTENYNFTETKELFEGYTVLSLAENPDIKIYTTDKRCIYCENLDKLIDSDMFIFPTTHRSEAGISSLSVHAPGNWDKAELGGKERTLAPADAVMQKKLFAELNKLKQDFKLQASSSEQRNKSYETTLECTHHGPEMNKPTAFIEIGTGEKQWKDKEAGKIIATAIMNALKNNDNNYKTALALGGPHYMPNFKEIVLNTNIAIGHCCPKHMLQNLDEEMIKQAINKTTPKAEFALLDWKGLGTEKQRIIQLMEKLDVEYRKTKKAK